MPDPTITTQTSLFAAAPDRPPDPSPTLVRERTVRLTVPALVRDRAVRPDTRPRVEFVLEGRSGPLYRGRGRLVERRAYDASRLVAPGHQVEVELRDVVWDDEPVAGATGMISVAWDEDEAWVFPYEIESITNAPARAPA